VQRVKVGYNFSSPTLDQPIRTHVFNVKFSALSIPIIKIRSFS